MSPRPPIDLLIMADPLGEDESKAFEMRKLCSLVQKSPGSNFDLSSFFKLFSLIPDAPIIDFFIFDLGSFFLPVFFSVDKQVFQLSTDPVDCLPILLLPVGRGEASGEKNLSSADNGTLNFSTDDQLCSPALRFPELGRARPCFMGVGERSSRPAGDGARWPTAFFMIAETAAISLVVVSGRSS